MNTSTDTPLKGGWEIWAEGYLATGMEGTPQPATLIGVMYGVETFADACHYFFTGHPGEPHFRPASLTFWGCRLFENEADARASFG